MFIPVHDPPGRLIQNALMKIQRVYVVATPHKSYKSGEDGITVGWVAEGLSLTRMNEGDLAAIE